MSRIWFGSMRRPRRILKPPERVPIHIAEQTYRIVVAEGSELHDEPHIEGESSHRPVRPRAHRGEWSPTGDACRPARPRSRRRLSHARVLSRPSRGDAPRRTAATGPSRRIGSAPSPDRMTSENGVSHCRRREYRPRIVHRLEHYGHTIKHVDYVPELGKGTNDDAIATYSLDTDRLILTNDDDFLREFGAGDYRGLLFVENRLARKRDRLGYRSHYIEAHRPQTSRWCALCECQLVVVSPL
jgi:hypothetical protein